MVRANYLVRPGNLLVAYQQSQERWVWRHTHVRHSQTDYFASAGGALAECKEPHMREGTTNFATGRRRSQAQ